MGQFKNYLGYTPEEQLQQHRQVEAAYDAAVRKSEQKEEDRILANAFPSSESFWDNPRNPSVADVKRLNYKYAPYITPETWSYDKKSVTDDAYNGRSVANYPYDHQVYQAPQQSELLNN